MFYALMGTFMLESELSRSCACGSGLLPYRTRTWTVLTCIRDYSGDRRCCTRYLGRTPSYIEFGSTYWYYRGLNYLPMSFLRYIHMYASARAHGVAVRRLRVSNGYEIEFLLAVLEHRLPSVSSCFGVKGSNTRSPSHFLLVVVS